MKELEFDVVFHLAGEQICPNYMAIKLCDAKKHILITTSKTKNQYDRLKKNLNLDVPDFLHMETEALDYVAIYDKLDKKIGEYVSCEKIGFNVTGGTKPMFAAALDVCRNHNVTPVYFDTQQKKIRFFVEGHPSLDMPPVFKSVEEFIHLANYTVTKPGRKAIDILDMTKRQLLRSLWTARNDGRMRKATGLFSAASEKDKYNRREARASYYDACDVLERISSQGYGANLALYSNWQAAFPAYSVEGLDFGRGGWFEAWILAKLADSKKASSFLDLQTSVFVRPLDALDQEKDHQELDVVFTDGYNLTVIECKAGEVKQEAYQKLEKIANDLGGSFGRGVLCSVYELESQGKDRLSYSKLSCVCESALESLDKFIHVVKPKVCYKTIKDFQ